VARRHHRNQDDRLAAVQAQLAVALQRVALGGAGAARHEADALMRRATPGELGRAVRSLAHQLLSRQADAGWLPADLIQIVHRRQGEAAAELVADALADWCAGHAQAAVHALWHDQLRACAARVWWQPHLTHLEQWARQFVSALGVAVNVLACLGTLPALALIVPPPGRASQQSGPRRQVDDALLTRVRTLLAKAESTDYPPEAEALSAKAQQMMSRHGLSRAVLDHERGVQAEVTTARMWLDNPYLTAKASLVQAVAAANRCRVVYHSSLGMVSVLGEPSDLDATVLLATSLLVQASRAMLAEGSRVGYAGQSRTKSFRHAFLVAYAQRIGERLAEADHAGQDELASELDGSGPGALVPALARRTEAVDAALARDYPRLTGQRTTIRSADGWHAGRQAANRADLRRGDTAIDVA
jgi:hypothetical protein